MSKKQITKIDFENINAAADAETVFSEIGMRIVRKGGKKLILCPGHKTYLGREDKSVGSCFITKHGCYCYACGRGYSIIDSVSMYLGIPVQEAAVMVANICGLSAYETKEIDTKKREFRLLTQEEKELLGLFQSSNKDMGLVVGTIDFSDKNKELKKGEYLSRYRYADYDDVGKEKESYYIKYLSVPVSHHTLENDNYLECLAETESEFNVYHWMVCEKTKEKYYQIENLRDSLLKPLENKELIQAFYQTKLDIIEFAEYLNNQLQRLKRLYIDFNGDVTDLDNLNDDYFKQNNDA